MENHVKYRDSIYFHDDETIYVNLFIPSAVTWKQKGATLTQTTSFPEASTTNLRWTTERPVHASLKLRHPGWSRTASVLVNGAEVARSNNPGTYVDVTRTWKSGDAVELRMEMKVAAEAHPAAPDIVAFTYGPLVLAGALGRDGLGPQSDIVVNERKYGEYNDAAFTAPILIGDPRTIASAVQARDGTLEFTIDAADRRSVRMVPYHRIAHERYATYWPIKRA